MRRMLAPLVALALVLPAIASAQQEESYDYFRFNRDMVQNGLQSLIMCNGLFTSNRTVEQVLAQELAYTRHAVGTGRAVEHDVDWDRKAVAIGVPGGTPVMRSAFREGLGCVIMAPDQTYVDIESLPILTTPPPPGDPASMPWPMGDLVEERSLPRGVDADALAAASDWAFERESPEQVTLSLLIVHGDQIIHERYAPGFDISTKTRTWSTAKSIGVTLIGMLVDEGRMALDEPLGIEWLPQSRTPEFDPRNQITLRHVLNMSSGLYTVDSRGMEYATGSGLSYWAGASSVNGALDRGLIHEPGTFWDYENYDTILAVYAMKLALGDPQTYMEYPRAALLDKLGMRNTFLSVDRFGDFILSSQVYTNPRDLARFGMLYLQNGVWEGERLLSEEWIEFVRTPAPATADIGNAYGGQWWLVPDNRTDVPHDAYSTAGNRGQYVVVVPSHNLVIVRRGLDYGRQGFNRWDLTREVLKAIRN